MTGGLTESHGHGGQVTLIQVSEKARMLIPSPQLSLLGLLRVTRQC